MGAAIHYGEESDVAGGLKEVGVYQAIALVPAAEDGLGTALPDEVDVFDGVNPGEREAAVGLELPDDAVLEDRGRNREWQTWTLDWAHWKRS